MRAPLSNASPAASSCVGPSTSQPARGRSTRASSVWPPVAIRIRNGGSNGSGSRKLAATWPVQVVDRGQRQPVRRRERLRGRDADEQRADEPGALRDGHRVELRQRRRRPARARRRRPRRSAPGGGARRPRGRRRRSGRGRPARRSRSRGSRRRASRPRRRCRRSSSRSRGSRGAAAHVRHVVERPASVARRAPHDQRVLAVVLVVAAAACRPSGSRSARRARSPAVRGPHLERVAARCRAVVDPLQQRAQQRVAIPAGAGPGRPRCSSGARRCRSASRSGGRRASRRARGEAHARRLRQLQHEHRQRPRGREGTPLDRDHLRQVGVGEAADLERRRESRCGWRAVCGAPARRPEGAGRPEGLRPRPLVPYPPRAGRAPPLRRDVPRNRPSERQLRPLPTRP